MRLLLPNLTGLIPLVPPALCGLHLHLAEQGRDHRDLVLALGGVPRRLNRYHHKLEGRAGEVALGHLRMLDEVHVVDDDLVLAAGEPTLISSLVAPLREDEPLRSLDLPLDQEELGWGVRGPDYMREILSRKSPRQALVREVVQHLQAANRLILASLDILFEGVLLLDDLSLPALDPLEPGLPQLLNLSEIGRAHV